MFPSQSVTIVLFLTNSSQMEDSLISSFFFLLWKAKQAFTVTEE